MLRINFVTKQPHTSETQTVIAGILLINVAFFAYLGLSLKYQSK